MTAKIDLSSQVRTETGKRASRRLRRTDKILGSVYGASKENTLIVLDHYKVAKAMENQAFYSSILTLNINDQPEKVVIKAIQRHPYKAKIQHMDFFRINMKEKLNMQIPLHFLGEAQAPGLKAGGIISHLMTEVEVRCLPADLPEFIDVDVSNLELDQYIYLTDLQLPANVELVAFLHGKPEDHNQPVVNLHMPHIIEEPVAEVPLSPEVEATKVAPEAKAAEGEAGGKEKEKESKK